MFRLISACAFAAATQTVEAKMPTLRHVVALDIAVILQALAKCGQHKVRKRARLAVEKPYHRLRRLLRPRRDRPSYGRTAEERDELAPLHHSITSSARTSRAVGISMPSVLAVLRLTISSTFVTCCTGRSEGFSPFRMRPA